MAMVRTMKMLRSFPDRRRWTGTGPLARLALLSLLLCGRAAAAEYFVSPSGSDSADGSVATPFRTLQYTVTRVVAGDSITMRGGVYPIGVTVRPLVSGTAVSPILLRAYPGESPILDFSLQTPSTSARGLHFSASYWHVKGLTVRNAGDNGIFISGNYNVVENCTMYGNEDTGLQISNGGSNNYVYNCDSYANYDSATHGENADGFAPKLDVGPGNVIRGCRAWDNADDGWDAYQAAYEVVIDSCWSFRNGYNLWGDPAFQGDGNGFKLGGNFVPAHQLITRSVAFDNRSKGFDQNNNTAGITLYNNTAWRNLGNNFSFPLTPNVGQHVLIDNIACGAVSIEPTASQSSNSWQGYTVTAGDFLSLDTALATAPRNPDGSLPDVDFLHLSGASQFINAGEDVGLPYLGSAPDLGAFESGSFPTTFPLVVYGVDGTVEKDPDGTVYDSATVGAPDGGSRGRLPLHELERGPRGVGEPRLGRDGHGENRHGAFRDQHVRPRRLGLGRRERAPRSRPAGVRPWRHRDAHGRVGPGSPLFGVER